jgi:Aromatic acid exporter family member 1
MSPRTWSVARLRSALGRLRSEALRLIRGPAPGVRTAKTVLAAVVSFAVAQALHTSGSPVLAPLTALLVVQLTMYETFAHGRERIVSVVAGVLLAVLFASVTGLTWWSLGIVVAVSIVAGRLLRLGPHLLEVPISAMLVLAVGGAERAALGRVEETLIGAAVGVLVNLLIAPPLYIRPASAAIADLAEEMARFTGDLAAALRGTWSRDEAEAQLTRARMLGEDVARADRQLARTEESARLNPRGRVARQAEPRLRSTLGALEHAQVGLRNLVRALLDRTFFVPEDAADAPYPPGVREALADVLDAVTEALHAAAGVPSGAAAGHGEQVVALLERRRAELAERLLVDPRIDQAAWSQHGSLLDAVDRLRVELATALRPPELSTLAPLAERQRRAVRQALRGARNHRRGP